MKLSKTLLSALLTGIALQGLISCEKELDSKTQKVQPANATDGKQHEEVMPGNCPACGMG